MLSPLPERRDRPVEDGRGFGEAKEGREVCHGVQRGIPGRCSAPEPGRLMFAHGGSARRPRGRSQHGPGPREGEVGRPGGSVRAAGAPERLGRGALPTSCPTGTSGSPADCPSTSVEKPVCRPPPNFLPSLPSQPLQLSRPKWVGRTSERKGSGVKCEEPTSGRGSHALRGQVEAGEVVEALPRRDRVGQPRRWQLPHQKRLRPATTWVRIREPHTTHDSPALL